jgi:hypothetical protein
MRGPKGVFLSYLPSRGVLHELRQRGEDERIQERQRVRLFFIARMIMTAWGLAVSLVFAAGPELAGEAARAGRLTREQGKPVAHRGPDVLGSRFETNPQRTAEDTPPIVSSMRLCSRRDASWRVGRV